jgi:hypothetical protein
VYIDQLIDTCDSFQDLGWAVTEQLSDFVRGERGHERLNPEALRQSARWADRVERVVSDDDLRSEMKQLATDLREHADCLENEEYE